MLSLSLFIIVLALAMQSWLLSKKSSKNTRDLQELLKRVRDDANNSEIEKIDLYSDNAQAYRVLERIIEQAKIDRDVAQEASEAKTIFLANASHEIRTPLNGIVGFAELLADADLKEEQKEFVKNIEKSSKELLQTTSNILDLTKASSTKQELEDITFDPIVEFESAVEIYAARTAQKDIDFGFFIDPVLEQPLRGDPFKVKAVIINLLSNAVKFTNARGSINVEIREQECEKEGVTRVRFEVRDSGIGVSSEQKSKIFEAFLQADNSIARKYGGSGLGLTISSRYVELMGGSLEISSEIGMGTALFFSIDFKEAKAKNRSLRGRFSNIVLLLLIDSHRVKAQDNYLREYLDFYGARYVEFRNFDEFKELARSLDYDFIFIDYAHIKDDELSYYSSFSKDLVLFSRSCFMRNIGSLNIDIFKTIYEPLNASKLKKTFENHSSKNGDFGKKFKCVEPKERYFKANALVAEDNIINQKLMKKILESLGLSVTLANNGFEAFTKRKERDFDIIFMDIEMPLLDGIEATSKILEYEREFNKAHIPILALTANRLKGDRERFLAAGIDESVAKPITRAQIVNLLDVYLIKTSFKTSSILLTPTISKDSFTSCGISSKSLS